MVHIHFLNLKHWFALLLRRYSKLLLGGFDVDKERDKGELLLETFWENYRNVLPDHSIYREHDGAQAELEICNIFDP